MKVVRDQADSVMIHDGLDPASVGPFIRADYWARLWKDYVRREPVAYFSHYIIGTIENFVIPGTYEYSMTLNLAPNGMEPSRGAANMIGDFFRRKSGAQFAIAFYVTLFTLLSYAAIVVGLIVGWRKYDRAFLAACLIIALYLAIQGGAMHQPRMKMPSMIYFWPFAGIGAVHLLDLWTRRASKRIGLARVPGHVG